MTVLSGGISDGHLWDRERRRDTFAGFDYWLPVPMLPMTAEDLGGYTTADGAHWPVRNMTQEERDAALALIAMEYDC